MDFLVYIISMHSMPMDTNFFFSGNSFWHYLWFLYFYNEFSCVMQFEMRGWWCMGTKVREGTIKFGSISLDVIMNPVIVNHMLDLNKYLMKDRKISLIKKDNQMINFNFLTLSFSAFNPRIIKLYPLPVMNLHRIIFVF